MKKDDSVVIERPYTLRKLKDGDFFPLLNLLRKVGAAEIKRAVQNVDTSGGAQKVGLAIFGELVDVILINIPAVEEDLYAFCSGISGMTVDAIKELEFGTMPLMLYDMFDEAGNSSFFKVLYSRLK